MRLNVLDNYNCNFQFLDVISSSLGYVTFPLFHPKKSIHSFLVSIIKWHSGSKLLVITSTHEATRVYILCFKMRYNSSLYFLFLLMVPLN